VKLRHSGEAPARRLYLSDMTQRCDEELRMVMVGKTGSGKSTTGNIILGRQYFDSRCCATSMTKQCLKARGSVAGQTVAVIDTPGLCDTEGDEEKTRTDVSQCISFCSPGPHVFLVVVKVGRFTVEEKQTVQKIQEMFGEAADRYSMVLFTHGDLLDGSIQDYMKDSADLQELVARCNGRYHVFNNKMEDRQQVTELLQKVRDIVLRNGGEHYTNEMFQRAETEIQDREREILKEKEEEIEEEKKKLQRRLQAEYEEKLKEVKEEEEMMERDNERVPLVRQERMNVRKVIDRMKEWERKEREERERKERIERERNERIEMERRARIERERMKERERIEKDERERGQWMERERETRERERMERQRTERETMERQRLERERTERERRERERMERERMERERTERERMERERTERQRMQGQSMERGVRLTEEWTK
ncbi:hypothetical protein INR49_008340, partial [Caranx melampygus]